MTPPDTPEESAGEVDAAQAFEDLRGEVAQLRRSVQGLSGEWKANRPPDYTVTLGAIAKGMANVAGRLELIEGHPALELTPEQHRDAIAQAGSALMREAAQKLDHATAVVGAEQRELAAMIGTMRGKWKQLEWLMWTGLAAFFFGLLICPMFVRVLPFGWDAQIAAFILQADRWHAGQALMQSDDPAGWATLSAEVSLVEPNHAALTACREAAAKLKKAQSCAIVVPAP
jgi:hypothetical protein